MKTSRKPAPIQTPAWANQFIRLCGLLAETCSDADAAVQSARMALGCMAELGNVRGDVYTEVSTATSAYVRAAVWHVRTTRAYNATPWHNDAPEFMRVALDGAGTYCSERRAALETALRNVRPSLSMT